MNSSPMVFKAARRLVGVDLADSHPHPSTVVDPMAPQIDTLPTHAGPSAVSTFSSGAAMALNLPVRGDHARIGSVCGSRSTGARR
jgi:hypothetical protein